MKTDILIVGGGLAGLALADQLHRAGRDFQLIEARQRFGGRIKTAHYGGTAFDLGPSWLWPEQPRLARLIERLNLTIFDQYSSGEVSFEDENGAIHRGIGFASMEGSWRIRGGMSAIIDGLVAELPDTRLHLGSSVNQLSSAGSVTLSDGRKLVANQIVLALPPRVAATLDFSPALTPQSLRMLESIPTWMGGQAKFLAIYDKPFWRDDGFSGDATSRRGPLAEIHDASDMAGTPAALFGFVGIPVATRRNRADELKAAAVAQLARIFGHQALSPKQVWLSDWAFATETASALDHASPAAHPTYGLPPGLADLWEGRLHFCATEVAAQFGGYLEGALCAADALSQALAKAAHPPECDALPSF